MNKKLRLLITALAGASIALALAWTPALAAESESYTYVATEVGGGLFASRQTPAGAVAPGGIVWLDPKGSALTLQIDDHAARKGQAVPVKVVTDKKTLFRGCMPVRTPVTLTGTGGERVAVLIGHLYGGPCSATATAGVLTAEF